MQKQKIELVTLEMLDGVVGIRVEFLLDGKRGVVGHQLHENEDGTLKIPDAGDSDLLQLHLFAGDVDIARSCHPDCNGTVESLCGVEPDVAMGILYEAMALVGDDNHCVKNELGILYDSRPLKKVSMVYVVSVMDDIDDHEIIQGVYADLETAMEDCKLAKGEKFRKSPYVDNMWAGKGKRCSYCITAYPLNKG